MHFAMLVSAAAVPLRSWSVDGQGALCACGREREQLACKDKNNSP